MSRLNTEQLYDGTLAILTILKMLTLLKREGIKKRKFYGQTGRKRGGGVAEAQKPLWHRGIAIRKVFARNP